MAREEFLKYVEYIMIFLAFILFIVIIFLLLLKVSKKRYLNKRFLCNYDWVCLTSDGENKFKDDKDINICEGTPTNIQSGDIVGLCDNDINSGNFKYGACDERGTKFKNSTTAYYPYFEDYFSYYDPDKGTVKIGVNLPKAGNSINDVPESRNK